MNQEPLLILKAKYTKILVMFIFITIIQYVSYSYVQESIKYSFNSALILTGLSIMEFVLILLIIKNGLPQIRFFESHCIIQLYIISLFHKSKNEQSLADYLYRRILNIHA